MLIFRGKLGVDTSESTLKERLHVHMNWVQKLGDQHVDSQRLEEVGAHIKNINNVETEGTFIEDKEIIIGFTIIAAKNLDDAIFLAKTCPLLNYYEIIVRPVVS